jgi:hypothetical protein
MKIKIKAWVHEPVQLKFDKELEITDDPKDDVIIFKIPIGIPADAIACEAEAVFGVDRTEFRRAIKALQGERD